MLKPYARATFHPQHYLGRWWASHHHRLSPPRGYHLLLWVLLCCLSQGISGSCFARDTGRAAKFIKNCFYSDSYYDNLKLFHYSYLKLILELLLHRRYISLSYFYSRGDSRYITPIISGFSSPPKHLLRVEWVLCLLVFNEEYQQKQW